MDEIDKVVEKLQQAVVMDNPRGAHLHDGLAHKVLEEHGQERFSAGVKHGILEVSLGTVEKDDHEAGLARARLEGRWEAYADVQKMGLDSPSVQAYLLMLVYMK